MPIAPRRKKIPSGWGGGVVEECVADLHGEELSRDATAPKVRESDKRSLDLTKYND